MEPGLRRALAGRLRLSDVDDAISEALAYAWEHRERLMRMEHAGGYLYRVCQSRARRLRRWQREVQSDEAELWPARPSAERLVEPRLVAAMRTLPPRQREAVWLIHGAGWTYAETADAMGVSTSSVSAHVARALQSLRASLRVEVPRG